MLERQITRPYGVKLSRELQAAVHLAWGALGQGRKRNCIMRAVDRLALAFLVSDPNQGLCRWTFVSSTYSYTTFQWGPIRLGGVSQKMYNSGKTQEGRL